MKQTTRGKIKIQEPRLRFAAALFSLILAFSGQFFLYHEKNTAAGFILFAASSVFFIIAVNMRDREKTQAENELRQMTVKNEIVCFILIIITASFFRFYQLDTLPPGAHRDEAKAALDALYISEGRAPMQADSSTPLYIRGITDNPAVYNYILAVFYKFHPSGATTGRVGSAFLGVLAVAAMYFLARSIGGVNLAIIAGFMFAISRWHFTFTRHILHAGFLVFIMILAMYYCVKAYEQRKMFFFLLAGFCCGFVLYTFQAGRAIVPAVFICVLFLFFAERNFFMRNREKVLYSAFVFFITVIPITMYMIFNFDTFMLRTSDLNILSQTRFNAQKTGLNGIMPVYFKNLFNAFLMCNKTGSINFVYNFNRFPMLDFVTGIFFIPGLLYSVYKTVNGSKFYSMLVILYLVSIQGTALFIEAPHATRAVMIMPLVIIFAAIAAEKFRIMFVSSAPEFLKKLIIPAAIGVLFLAVYDNYRIYFDLFKKDARTWQFFSADGTQAGRYFSALGPGWNAILDPKYDATYEGYAFYLEASALKKSSVESLDVEKQIAKGQLKEGNNVFILSPAYIGTAYSLERAFPGGVYEPVYEKYNPDQLSFFAYKVSKGAVFTPAVLAENGLHAWYYSKTDSKVKTVRRIDTILDIFWKDRAPVPVSFTVDWYGKIDIEKAGIYQFVVNTRGFCELKINDSVLFSGMPPDSQSLRGKIKLSQGSHKLEMKSIQTKLPARVELRYLGPDTGGIEQVVPARRLSH